MDSLVVVFRAAGMPKAELVRGLLESEDIPVHLQYESAGPVYGLTVDGLGEVKVCVPEAYVEDARALLRALRSRDGSWGEEEEPPTGPGTIVEGTGTAEE